MTNKHHIPDTRFTSLIGLKIEEFLSDEKGYYGIRLENNALLSFNTDYGAMMVVDINPSPRHYIKDGSVFTGMINPPPQCHIKDCKEPVMQSRKYSDQLTVHRCAKHPIQYAK